MGPQIRTGIAKLEDELREGVVDSLLHVAEQPETLTLVFDLRIPLGVASEIDRLAQRIHGVEVPLPLLIQDLELEVANDPIEGRVRLDVRVGLFLENSSLFLLCVEGFRQFCEDGVTERIAVAMPLAIAGAKRGFFDREGLAELSLERMRDLDVVIVFWLAALGPDPIDQVRNGPFQTREGFFFERLIVCGHRGQAPGVECLALLVHDVVVVEQMFTDVEVATLDLLLRAFDHAGQHAILDRLALFHPDSVPPVLDTIRLEYPQEVVFE